MRRIIWNWVISSIALWLGTSILSPEVSITTPPWYNIFWISALLGLTNVFVGLLTFLIKVLTLPINILTMGCFGFFISLIMNSIAIYFVSSNFAPTVFHVASFKTGFELALLMSIFSSILTMILPFKGNKS